MKRNLRLGVWSCLVLLFSCSPEYEVIFVAANQMNDTISLAYTEEGGNFVVAYIPPGNNYEIQRRKLPGYGASFTGDKSFTISYARHDSLFSSKNLNEKTEWIQDANNSDIDIFYLYLNSEDF